MKGVIDRGAEITIVSGKLFKQIAVAARLKKSQLMKPDKIPKTYNHKTFTLDGRVDLDISFDGVTMQTPVYNKLDALELLLLAKGVCQQLNIVKYHPSIVGEGNRGEKEPAPCTGVKDKDQCEEHFDDTIALYVT